MTRERPPGAPVRAAVRCRTPCARSGLAGGRPGPCSYASVSHQRPQMRRNRGTTGGGESCIFMQNRPAFPPAACSGGRNRPSARSGDRSGVRFGACSRALFGRHPESGYRTLATRATRATSPRANPNDPASNQPKPQSRAARAGSARTASNPPQPPHTGESYMSNVSSSSAEPHQPGRVADGEQPGFPAALVAIDNHGVRPRERRPASRVRPVVGVVGVHDAGCPAAPSLPRPPALQRPARREQPVVKSPASHRDGRRARLTRREEGAYRAICDRRTTPSGGMRRPRMQRGLLPRAVNGP